MKSKPVPLTIEDVRIEHAEKASAIRKRLDEFSAVRPEEYFYELTYCLLTPQSSAVNAAMAVGSLQRHGFEIRPIDPEPLLHQKDYYIRFHKTKATHLLAMKATFPRIAEKLASGSAGTELREWLVGNVKGMGWKEASHFLRNIGYRNLAILDRHILKNLHRLGVVRRLPKSLTSRRYKLLEKKFHTFALQIGIPMDELDLLFWSIETGEILK